MNCERTLIGEDTVFLINLYKGNLTTESYHEWPIACFECQESSYTYLEIESNQQIIKLIAEEILKLLGIRYCKRSMWKIDRHVLCITNNHDIKNFRKALAAIHANFSDLINR